MAIPLSYNVRNVLQRPVATLTTALGVGFTVAILIGALALAAGFEAALMATGSPDNVIVLRKGADGEISSGIDRDAANIIRAHNALATGPDGTPLISPEVVVLINKPRLGLSGSSNVTVRGIDPAGLALRDQVRVTAGRMFAPGAAEVIVGATIAPRFAGCGLGEKVRFGQQEFTVVGHFTSGGSSFESEIWGDNKVLMPAFRGEVFQSITFRLRDAGLFKAVKEEMEKDPRLAVKLEVERDFYSNQSEFLANFIRIAGTFITLIMAAGAVFGAMNTMYAAVASRTREIATLLVLGFSPMAVMLSFVIESVVLATAGGALGCLMALPINGITTSTTNFASFSEVAFSFRVTPAAMVAGLGYAALMGLVGGFFPALKAARQPLAASLRGE